MKKSNNILLIALMVMSLIGPACADVDLVKEGKPVADIVMGTNTLSSVKLAVLDLQKHIQKMSGATLDIVTAPLENMKNHVYVGESEYTKKLGVTVDDLKTEGFKIIAKDHYVVLVGRDEQRTPFPFVVDRHRPEDPAKWKEYAGENYAIPSVSVCVGHYNERLGIHALDATATLYASSELLEQLGVRWYNPYENGTVIPEKKNIAIPYQNLTKAPVFPVREFNYSNARRLDYEGVLWFKRLKYGASYLYHSDHSTYDIYSSKEQQALHPEYLARDKDGKPLVGYPPGYGTPRLSDPGFRKTSVNYLDKIFKAYPALTAMSVGMPDGFERIDARDAERWPDTGRNYEGKYSDYAWDYWVHVAAELKKIHPDKYLACTAYGTHQEPPSQIDALPENVTLKIAYNSATLMLPAGTALKALRSKWLSVLTSKRMYTHDWFLFYRDEAPRYPVVFTRLLQEDMQVLKGVCEGKIVEIVAEYPKGQAPRLACPGLTHMLHYWQGKLYWDPDMDRKKMLDEYYDLYFGPARAEMKEFYEFAEDVWMRPESRSISSVGGFLKEPDVDRYFDILSRARSKAGKDTVFDKRIVQIESEMEPLKKLFSNMKRTGPDFGGYITDEPIVIDGDLNKPFWRGKAWWPWHPMRGLVTGQFPGKNEYKTSVSFRMRPDKSALVIGVVCKEGMMDAIRAEARNNDDVAIFNDDRIECYIETPERSYFKIAVNANGAVWDESQDVSIVTRDTLPRLWNPGIKAAVKKEKDQWTVELMIPVKDFGSLGPTKVYPWGINVCRTRWASGKPECYAIAPTGQMCFGVLSKLGNLHVQ